MKIQLKKPIDESKTPEPLGALLSRSCSSAPVVSAIIGINLLLFLVMVLCTGPKSLILPSSQNLLNFGASSASSTIIAARYWRIASCAFVHVGLIHLAVNMFVLWDIGREVEHYYGHSKFLAIFGCAAIGGSITSLLANPNLISAGASGAIFGVFGAMLAIAWRRRELFPKGFLLLHGKIVLCLIAYTLIFSFFDKNLDNAAHFGGLITGFLAGLCLLPKSDEITIWRTIDGVKLAFLLSIYLAGIFVAHQMFNNKPELIADDFYRQAVELLNEEKSTEAIVLLDKALALTPKNAFMLHDRARAYSQQKNYERAVADCNAAFHAEPDDKIAYAARAAAYHKLGAYQKSVDDLTKLIPLCPQNAMPYNNRAWSYEAMGKYPEALADCNTAIELNRDLSMAYDTRAVAYICLAKFPEAQADLDKAISQKPTDGAYYYHRSIVFRASKSPDRSAVDSAKARELGYEPESWEPK